MRHFIRHDAAGRLAAWGLTACLTAVGAAASAAPARAQTFAVEDPVLRRFWVDGMEHSQVARLAQVLDDFIGPRLTGSLGYSAAAAWLQEQYRAWDVPTRAERYVLALGIVSALARNQSQLLLRLADNEAAPLLTLFETVLAIIRHARNWNGVLMLSDNRDRGGCGHIGAPVVRLRLYDRSGRCSMAAQAVMRYRGG